MSARKKNILLPLLSVSILQVLCAPVFSDLKWPLHEKSHLSGSFGEFRKNHIHAGTDLSTWRKIGLPVYAAESGTLHRVKTEVKGFGKAVYIKLKDGKVLVYAHLDRFAPEIEKVVTAAQEKSRKYQIDELIKKNIPIAEGEIIGYSGDTGGVAPHLHIELRDPNENPVNIQRFGLPVKDNTPPVITGLAICNPETTRLLKYYPKKNIPAEITVSGNTGLAISAHDPSNGNMIGVYKITVSVNNKQFFEVKMDTFSYDEFNDNFILCNKDAYVNHDKICYHLFRAFGNKLPFYQKDSDGVFYPSPGKYSVVIKTADFTGNETKLSFILAVRPLKEQNKYKFEQEEWLSDDKICGIKIAEKDLCYPFKVMIKAITSKKWNELIPVSKIYDAYPRETVFKKGIIVIKGPPDKNKIGLYKYEGTKWKYMDDNIITGLTRYALFRDITPPDIKILSTHPVFRAKIEDRGSGLDYDKLRLEVDGKVVIAEYSYNRKEFFAPTPPSSRMITCSAEDKEGNKSIMRLTNH